jgi:hypothetical protein
MKKLFLLVGCLLVLGSSPVFAVVAEDPSVVLVRAWETGLKPTITIVRGGSAPEVTKVKNGDFLVAYQQVIANLYAQGYVLQSSIGTSDGPIGVSTLIFVKPAKP